MIGWRQLTGSSGGNPPTQVYLVVYGPKVICRRKWIALHNFMDEELHTVEKKCSETVVICRHSYEFWWVIIPVSVICVET
jgi:hypothetical protein